MVAEDILNSEFPCLELSDQCMKAVTYMDEYKLSHYPVLDGTKFEGLIFEEDLYEIENWEQSIHESKVRIHPIFVSPNDHLLKVVGLVTEANLSCVPVVSGKQHYLGLITDSHLLHTIGSLPLVRDVGGLIEIELPVIDYALSDIVRIIETNNARILGTYIITIPEQRIIRLTVKLHKRDISRVISALERYEYTVVASYQHATEQDDLQDRFDNLMHFLNL